MSGRPAYLLIDEVIFDFGIFDDLSVIVSDSSRREKKPSLNAD
jgi:hypothetical protein